MTTGRSEEEKRRMVEANLGLAADLAAELADPSWSRLDAVQEANVVLMQVVGDAAIADPSVVLRQRISDHFDRVRGSGR